MTGRENKRGREQGKKHFLKLFTIGMHALKAPHGLALTHSSGMLFDFPNFPSICCVQI